MHHVRIPYPLSCYPLYTCIYIHTHTHTHTYKPHITRIHMYRPHSQNTMYEMAKLVFFRLPHIQSMELHLPNIHYFKADLSKFNITNSAGEVGHINDCSNCRNKLMFNLSLESMWYESLVKWKSWYSNVSVVKFLFHKWREPSLISMVNLFSSNKSFWWYEKRKYSGHFSYKNLPWFQVCQFLGL